MAIEPQTKLRIPLLLLVAADLVLLGMRVRPWGEILSLPDKGSSAIDPAVCLCGYFGLILWFTSRSGSRLISAQSEVTFLGLLAGALIGMEIWVSGLPSGARFDATQMILLCAGGVVWGIAGVRAARAAGSVGSSLIPGVWAAMVSTLIACGVELGQFYISGPPPDTPDAYKQFQEIGMGDPATVVLIHALTAVTGLLLIGPLIGGTLALIFAFFARKREPQAT
jgi:hypothetical protein